MNYYTSPTEIFVSNGAHTATIGPNKPIPVHPIIEQLAKSMGAVITAADAVIDGETVAVSAQEEGLAVTLNEITPVVLKPGESSLANDDEEIVDMVGDDLDTPLAPEPVVEEKVESTKDEDSLLMIASVMENILAENDKDLLTGDGVPRVNEIESRMDRKVTSKERDEAWEMVLED